MATRMVESMGSAMPEEMRAMAGPLVGMLQQMAGAMVGGQAGQAVGALALEVVGSTDIGLPLAPAGVGALLPSGVRAFGEGLEVDEDEVRLYLALREAAHVRLFEHVPWLRSHLLSAVEDCAPQLTLWTHGERSTIAPLLDARGYRRTRLLHQLRMPLDVPAPEVPLPEGVTVRSFAVGSDEDAWLRVNAAAFAEHAEQGGWTREDLLAREAEEWFDPAGFFLAWRADELLGFHWTKVHPDGTGEVYVIGVDPAAQGLGLGAVLLQRGLAWLRERGCPDVLLYVDGDNIGAMRLYERYGFAPHDLDVQWRCVPD